MDGRKTEGLKERREGGSKKIERKRRRKGGRGNKERKEGIIYSRSKTSASLCSLHPTQHAFLLLLSSSRVSHLPKLFWVTHTRTAVCCSIFPLLHLSYTTGPLKMKNRVPTFPHHLQRMAEPNMWWGSRSFCQLKLIRWHQENAPKRGLRIAAGVSHVPALVWCCHWASVGKRSLRFS